MRKVSRLRAGVLIALGLLASPWAMTNASAFPDKPITLVVPFSPGGGTDILARTIAPKVAEVLGESIIIENRGGAGGNIGANRVAKAKPDGYTILFGSNTLSINASLYQALPFDTVNDFSAIGLVAAAPLVLVVNPQTGIKSVSELVQKAKSEPGTLNWSTPGAGTPHHLAMALFNKETGANLTQVQYKGGGPAITDLVGNHTQASVLTLASVSSYIDAGKLTALGVATAARSDLMPDVPTIAEAGVPGYSASLWYGLFAPAGTSTEVIKKLNDALNKALEAPDTRQSLKQQGYETRPGSPDALQKLLVDDLESSAQTIEDANIPKIN